jgi:zinc protease
VAKQTLNRKAAPLIHAIQQPVLPHPECIHLNNGMKVYVLRFPGQQLLRVEVVFNAGRTHETQRVTARATARLMREGVTNRTGAEIAETFDFYGASYSSPSNLDQSGFSLVGLRKYARETLPLFADILLRPVFSPYELDTFIQNNIRQLAVELERVEVIAYREFTEKLYGSHHPYGYNSTPEDYQALRPELLKEFWHRHFIPDNGSMFLAGDVDDEIIDLLNELLPPSKNLKTPVTVTVPSPIAPTGTFKITKKGALQTAIKMGRIVVNRRHPDFSGLAVLNTVLGGYFGSRLMSNIREKKGYTYNIYSSIESMAHSNYLCISTEVSTGKANAVLKAIKYEIKQLQEELIPDEELDMVRNYLLGLMLTSLDGPMNTAEMVKNLILEGQGIEGFEQQVATIRSVTATQLRQLAQTYLNPDEMLTLIVG